MPETSIRSDILKVLNSKFSGLSLWKRVEPDVASLCADLPEPKDEETKKKFIQGLKEIKKFFLDEEIPIEDLEFIDGEIERHQETKTISLYDEEEDKVREETIDNYARLGKRTEGIVGIHHDFNYNQLTHLTNGVFKRTGLVKFYISKEQTLYGQIIAEIYDYAQKIPIAHLVESKKEDEDLGFKVKKVFLFGQKFSGTKWNILKEISMPFYVYRFITEQNDDLILLSSDKKEIGDYVVTGVKTLVTDFKNLTDSAKIPTKLPFFFAQEVKNRIVKYQNHEEFFNRIKYLGINKENTFDFPFTIEVEGKMLKLLQPLWYKWLVWSWLTHQEKGMINSYPFHILQIGPKHSGKSLLLNALHEKSKETRPVFSGSSSTLKSLVPSFKYSPAKIGYLAESNRFAFCDEFLRCLISTRTTKEGSTREESVAIMNDLLEHQKRQVGSGVSSVNINMTSRTFSTTNPIRGINNVEDLVNSFDESFLSRWLIYYQGKDHVQMIRKSRDANLETHDFKVEDNDWISLMDYLHSFSAEYDMGRVEEVLASVPKILTENLARHYDARHSHHIECLIDGIVKTRCMLELDYSFKAKEEDYDILEKVWKRIVGSWIRPESIRKVDVQERIFYLPENCQYIYWKMVAKKEPMRAREIKEIALKAMENHEFYDSYAILKEMGLIKEDREKVKLYFYDD